MEKHGNFGFTFLRSKKANPVLKLQNTGFTFIELILVVAIISIVTILSTSFYARFLLQNAVNNTTEQIAGSLRKAQLYSTVSRQGSNWGVNLSGGKITLFKGPSFVGRDPSFDETFTLNPNINITGWNDVVFTRVTGSPTPTSLSATITGSNTTRTINMNSQGVVSKS